MSRVSAWRCPPEARQPTGCFIRSSSPMSSKASFFAEKRLILAGDAGEDGVGGGPCTKIGQRQVLLDGHVGGGTLERVLKQMADDPAALIFRREGDVLAAQRDAALVGNEPAGDGVEQGGLARAVGTHDGGKKSPASRCRLTPFRATFRSLYRG